MWAYLAMHVLPGFLMKSTKKITVIQSIDSGYDHISLSHPHRLPTWDEIKYMRNKYGDPNKFYVIVLPPMEFYLNLHEFCMHLWEVKSEPEINIWKGM
jgi:hypothetical protein